MSIVEQLREDLRTHEGRISAPGFHAIAVYRFGRWGENKPVLVRKCLTLIYISLYTLVRNFYGIELPRQARVGRRLRLGHQHGIVVHPRTQIGDDCVIRHGVTLGAATIERITEAPTIGSGVSISPGVVIMGSVTVGDGANIGPNAVVITDVPPGATVFPTPSRVIDAAQQAG